MMSALHKMFKGPYLGIVFALVIIVFSFVFAQEYFRLTLVIGLPIILVLLVYRLWQPRMNQLSYYASLTKGGEEDKKTLLRRTKSEPAPATRGSGAPSLVVMYWSRWSRSIWQKYGLTLLGRETTIDKWADERDYSVLKPAAPEVLTGTSSVPALFADETREYIFYPRNKIIGKIKNQKITIADTNRYFMPENSASDLVPVLEPSTAAITSFPEGYAFVATPKNKNTINLWISLTGKKIVSGDDEIDKKFDFYVSDANFGSSILSKAALSKLAAFPSVRIVADRGVLVVVSLDGWVRENNLDSFCELAKKFSRNGYAIDEHIQSFNYPENDEAYNEEVYEE